MAPSRPIANRFLADIVVVKLWKEGSKDGRTEGKKERRKKGRTDAGEDGRLGTVAVEL